MDRKTAYHNKTHSFVNRTFLLFFMLFFLYFVYSQRYVEHFINLVRWNFARAVHAKQKLTILDAGGSRRKKKHSSQRVFTQMETSDDTAINDSYKIQDNELSICSHISDEQFVSFNTDDSLSDSIELSSNVHPEVVKIVSKVLENGLAYSSPRTCLEQNLKNINAVPGIKFNLPSTTHRI